MSDNTIFISHIKPLLCLINIYLSDIVDTKIVIYTIKNRPVQQVRDIIKKHEGEK